MVSGSTNDKEGINLLQQHGVCFESGLTSAEIKRAEAIYNIHFPKCLCDFLMQALPVSKGYYNWRDVTEKNIDYIKHVIEKPVNDLCSMAEDMEWRDEWGIEPKTKSEKIKRIKERVKCAPQMIPVFCHRYMPAVDTEEAPILSIHGTDIIYYGENLTDYIKVELGEKHQEGINFQNIMKLPFWSDLM